ncbi:hypothetical protein OKW23_000058 [Bacilli bacterium PM5-9]|nr:hypothetical protein [Bacilli bacterium PM5-9]
MKKGRIFAIVLIIILAIACAFVFYNQNNNVKANCFDTKQELDKDNEINNIINDYTLENKLDLFFYNSNTYKDNFETKSFIKWFEEDDITQTTDYITRVILIHGNKELDEQVIRFKVDMNNEVIDYTHILGLQDEVIDTSIDKKYYDNFKNNNCDIQK